MNSNLFHVPNLRRHVAFYYQAVLGALKGHSNEAASLDLRVGQLDTA